MNRRFGLISVIIGILFLALVISVWIVSCKSNIDADKLIADVDELLEEEDEKSSVDRFIEYSNDDNDILYSNETETLYTDTVSEVEYESIPIYSVDDSDDYYIADNDEGEIEVDEEWNQSDVPDAPDYIVDNDDWDSDWSDIPDSDDSEVVSWIAPQSDIHYGFTDDEVAEIARIVWLEVGICSCDYYTQYLTACVILNRYLDWGYGSLYEVIHASGQYATADMYTEYDGSAIRIGERTWSAVYDALADTDRNPHYQMRGGAGMPVYYWDTEWDVCFYY